MEWVCEGHLHAEQRLALAEREGSEVARSEFRGGLWALRSVRMSAVLSLVMDVERERRSLAARAASKSTRLFSLNNLR